MTRLVRRIKNSIKRAGTRYVELMAYSDPTGMGLYPLCPELVYIPLHEANREGAEAETAEPVPGRPERDTAPAVSAPAAYAPAACAPAACAPAACAPAACAPAACALDTCALDTSAGSRELEELVAS
jgi:hypothetical protein